MAVPTIISVAPVTGATIGGYLLRVTGTGFRLPPAPPAGYVGGPAPITVVVKVGGVAATSVNVWSATLLDCLVPEYTGAPLATSAAQAVQVMNLDDNGVPIVGETVTAAGAFSYVPTSIIAETRLDIANRMVLRFLARHVLANTVWRTHPDFDDSPADLTDSLAQARLPVLEVSGPRIERNRFYSRTARDYSPAGGGRSERREIPVTADLVYRLRIVTEHPGQLANAVQACMLAAERAITLPVAQDATAPAGAVDRWELAWEELPSSTALDERLHMADASIRVVGFDILEQDHMVAAAYELPVDPVVEAQST